MLAGLSMKFLPVIMPNDSSRYTVAETQPSILFNTFPVISTLGIQALGKFKITADESDVFVGVAEADNKISAGVGDRLDVI